MRNLVEENQERRDRREKTIMEEPSAITIEFLRARLFSERSVSRAVTERANKLAKRVVELEEQLKLVSLQRKKAERAAAQVLAILDSNGISELSEENYSGSDEDDGAPIESKGSSYAVKEGENLKASRKRINEAEMSVLDLQASSVTGRSLSWKSNGSSKALEKKKYISQSRQLISPVSIALSSTKGHLGKSSHPMKQKETRSAADEKIDDPHALEVQEDGVVGKSGDTENFEKDVAEILQGDARKKEVNVSLEDQHQETAGCLLSNGNERDADMERALEHQAQLIGCYEAEENAQREWEEKFGENNRCTPDYCEPGNQSDVTEESDEVREEKKDEVKEGTTESADIISPHGQEVKLGAEQLWYGEAIAKTVPNGILPSHFDNVCSQDQQGNSSTVDKSRLSMPEFPLPGQEKQESESNRKQKLDLPGNNLLHNRLHHSLEHQPGQKFSSFNGDVSLSKGESSGIQNELRAQGHHGAPTGLGGVLEALQLAKLSLNHKLGNSPLPAQPRPMEVERETPALAIEGGDVTEIPIKSDGLFRVPSSSQFKAATAQTRALATYPDSRSSLAGRYPSDGVGGARDYYSRLEIPIAPQIDASTHQMTRLGSYPDSRTSLTRCYSGAEVGFSADRFANLEMPSSSQLEATNFQRNLLKTYPDSRSTMGRYYPASEVAIAANGHANSEMGLEISNRRSLIDPYSNIGIDRSAYGRDTYSSYADHMSRMPISDEFLRPYTSMGSGMPPGDSHSTYDGQFRWKMDHR